MNKDGVLEKRYGYPVPKKNKNTETAKTNTILGRISYLALNFRPNNIENIEDTFYFYFDNDIIDKIVDCTNTRINETKARLQRTGNFNESSKCKYVKKPNSVEIDALFGLMYLRRILKVNLYMTDRLLPKKHFRFLKCRISTVHKKEHKNSVENR